MLDAIDWSAVNSSHAIALAMGYLLGAIPFGLILTRLAGTADIRTIGSGNIGATNVLRTGRKGLAAITLLCDLLKGTAAVVLAHRLFQDEHAILAGLGAFLGHVFPVWLRFKGGKGVATYIGVLIGLVWPATIAFAAIWAAVALITRYSSLSALLASAATPAVLWAMNDAAAAKLFFVLTILIWVTHRANITRLLAGTESQIGSVAKSPVTNNQGPINRG